MNIIDVRKDLDLGLQQAQKILNNEDVLVVPSETVYGLAGNIYSQKSVERIYQIKNRPSDNPLICHIYKIDQVFLLADLTLIQKQQVEALAQKFWPGPLTLILPKKRDLVNKNYAAEGFDTVAIRMPNHSVFLSLLELVDYPLAAPSANISGRPSGTHPQDIARELNDLVPLILKDEASLWGIESTVLDLTLDQPTILRPGAISLEALKQVLPDTILNTHNPKQQDTIKSPGQKYAHYKPNFPVYIWDKTISLQNSSPHRAIITAHSELKDLLTHYGKVFVYTNPQALAQDLYHLLYTLEQEGYKELWIQKYPLEGIGLGLMERINRMASLY